MEHLKLIVPDLLLDGEMFPIKTAVSQLNLQALEKLLACSERKQALPSGISAVLFDHFRVDHHVSTDQPIAALSRVGEGDDPDQAFWMRLDPVYLHPDRDSMVMFPNDSLVTDIAEAQALAAAIQAHFADLHWHIEVKDPLRWYLRLNADPQISTHALTDVVGHHLFDYLPKGQCGRQWHALLNEVQMLLHASPINQARQAKGQLPVNALWPWGGGILPAVQDNQSNVFGDDPLMKGLAELAGSRILPAVTDFKQLMAACDNNSTSVIILDELAQALKAQDIQRWLEGVLSLEARWFIPIRRAMKENRLQRLSIYSANGCIFESSARMQRRFWRRRLSVLSYNNA